MISLAAGICVVISPSLPPHDISQMRGSRFHFGTTAVLIDQYVHNILVDMAESLNLTQHTTGFSSRYGVWTQSGRQSGLFQHLKKSYSK